MTSAASTANITATTDESNATSRQPKLLFCSFIGCSGKNVRPDICCFVCGSSVHSSCYPEILLGQNVTSTNVYCSAQCIRYDQDSNINDNDVQSKHLALLENNKMQLRLLAHTLGVKISYRSSLKGLVKRRYCTTNIRKAVHQPACFLLVRINQLKILHQCLWW